MRLGRVCWLCWLCWSLSRWGAKLTSVRQGVIAGAGAGTVFSPAVPAQPTYKSAPFYDVAAVMRRKP